MQRTCTQGHENKALCEINYNNLASNASVSSSDKADLSLQHCNVLVQFGSRTELIPKQYQVLSILKRKKKKEKDKRVSSKVPCCGKMTLVFPWKLSVVLLVASPPIQFTNTTF